LLLNNKYSKQVQLTTGPVGVGVGVGHAGHKISLHVVCSVNETPPPLYIIPLEIYGKTSAQPLNPVPPLI
jgi:hypothetical protein